VLSGKVLLRAREERLWEEEARDPEDLWSSFIVPLRQEVNTIVAVLDPGSKRLQTEETFTFAALAPHYWYLVVIDRCSHLLKVL